MTDDKNNQDNLDLDKEIEQLDAFLSAHEEEFPLVDEDLFVAPTKDNQSKSGALGKYVSYIALLALLGGGGYAGYLYAPQLLKNSELSQLQNIMSDRNQSINTGNVETQPTEIIPLNTDYVAEIEKSVQNAEILNMDGDIVPTQGDLVESLNELPMAADEKPNEDGGLDVGFGDPDVDNKNTNELVNIEDLAKPAETIADALAIAQSVTEDAPQEEVELTQNVDVEDSDSIVTPQITDITTDDDIDAFETVKMNNDQDKDVVDKDSEFVERISASPLVKQTNDNADIESEVEGVKEVVLASTEVSIVENVIEVVETVGAGSENVAAEIVQGRVEPTKIVEQDTDEVEALIKEEAAAVEPNPPVVVVEEVKAVAISAKPVTQKMPSVKVSTPQKTSPILSNNPAPQRSEKVIEAKKYYDTGDYQSAVNLYQSALNMNPADIHALTGLQLAKAKLRRVDPSMTSMVEVEKSTENDDVEAILEMEATTAPRTQEKVQVETQSVGGSLQSLISQMQSKPRDASTAVSLADAYAKAGDKAQAMNYYRKALQLDVVYSSGLNRMAVYDAMALLSE